MKCLLQDLPQSGHETERRVPLWHAPNFLCLFNDSTAAGSRVLHEVFVPIILSSLFRLCIHCAGHLFLKERTIYLL